MAPVPVRSRATLVSLVCVGVKRNESCPVPTCPFQRHSPHALPFLVTCLVDNAGTGFHSLCVATSALRHCSDRNPGRLATVHGAGYSVRSKAPLQPNIIWVPARLLCHGCSTFGGLVVVLQCWQRVPQGEEAGARAIRAQGNSHTSVSLLLPAPELA